MNRIGHVCRQCKILFLAPWEKNTLCVKQQQTLFLAKINRSGNALCRDNMKETTHKITWRKEK